MSGGGTPKARSQAEFMKMMSDWVKDVTSGYDVSFNNFTTSFQNGYTTNTPTHNCY